MTTGRDWFSLAARGFLDVVRQVDPDSLDNPGLGEWDVRALLGHACRAFVTIENYLSEDGGEPDLRTAAEYFAAVRAGLADPAQVAERGRQAGGALGSDPTAEAVAIGEQVIDLVEHTPGSRHVATPVGSMTLDEYLPTRAFELTVHGIDLARATGQPIPETLMAAAVPAIELAAQVATPEMRTQILMTLTGRTRLDDDFTVL